MLYVYIDIDAIAYEYYGSICYEITVFDRNMAYIIYHDNDS